MQTPYAPWCENWGQNTVRIGYDQHHNHTKFIPVLEQSTSLVDITPTGLLKGKNIQCQPTLSEPNLHFTITPISCGGVILQELQTSKTVHSIGPFLYFYIASSSKTLMNGRWKLVPAPHLCRKLQPTPMDSIMSEQHSQMVEHEPAVVWVGLRYVITDLFFNS